MTAVYRYYCCWYSPDENNVPKGSAGWQKWGSHPFLPEAGRTVYGTVDYTSQLDGYEMAYYGLIPANVKQEPITI